MENDTPERPEVRRHTGCQLALDQLRRAVLRRAGECAASRACDAGRGLQRIIGAQTLGAPKVTQADIPVGGQQHILWLHIPVHSARSVDRRQRQHQLGSPQAGLLTRRLAAWPAGQLLLQVAAGAHVHDQVQVAGVLEREVEAHNAGSAPQPLQQLALPPRALRLVVAHKERLVHDLQRMLLAVAGAAHVQHTGVRPAAELAQHVKVTHAGLSHGGRTPRLALTCPGKVRGEGRAGWAIQRGTVTARRKKHALAEPHIGATRIGRRSVGVAGRRLLAVPRRSAPAAAPAPHRRSDARTPAMPQPTGLLASHAPASRAARVPPVCRGARAAPTLVGSTQICPLVSRPRRCGARRCGAHVTRAALSEPLRVEEGWDQVRGWKVGTDRGATALDSPADADLGCGRTNWAA